MEHTQPTSESLLTLLGGMPESGPLDVNVLAAQEHERYSQELIEYSIEGDERVQAFLLKPRPLHSKVPGILAIHQDGASRPYQYGKSEVIGAGGDGELKYGLELCLRGYVVICPDRFPYESRSLANSPYKEQFDCFRIFVRMEAGELELTEDLYGGCVGNRLLLEGKSPLGQGLFELQRAIDCLCAQPEVDADRIGVIGHSGGGHWGAYLMFIDPRIKVGCTSCGTWLMKWSMDKGVLRPMWGFGGVTPGLLRWGDMDDILAGFAPRPYLETRGDVDSPEQVEPLLRKAQARYAALGVPERFQYIVYNGGHTFRQDMRTKSYEWFDRWFE